MWMPHVEELDRLRESDGWKGDPQLFPWVEVPEETQYVMDFLSSRQELSGAKKEMRKQA